MANAYVEMDAKQYVQFMKESMAAKARAQNFKKVRFIEGGGGEATEAAVTFAQTLYRLLGRIVGMGENANPQTMGEIGTQISQNIGNNFAALKTYAQNIPGRVHGFFSGLGGRVTNWLGQLGKAVTSAAGWMQQNSSLTLGGTPLTNGTLIALAVLSAVILIGGYKFFKGLASKSDNQNQNTQQNQTVQQNQNTQTNNMQTNNAQPTESVEFVDNELQSYLDEGTKLTDEIMVIFTEQTELTEGIFDMFTWLGKMVKKAVNMVKEMFGYVGRFIKDHPVIAILVMACIFFVLFCTPALQNILGFWGKNNYSQLTQTVKGVTYGR